MKEKSFSLQGIIHDAIHHICGHGGEKPVWFDVIIDPTLPAYFEGDGKILSNLLLNLMMNAVKCTSFGVLKLLAQGTVNDEHYHVSISIADRGKGMEQEALEALLTLPHADAPLLGTADDGLYLYNSRKIARELGGDIQARSWVGVGTDFTLLLPLKHMNQ